MPRVSVILPYRNAITTLDEALKSVLDERGVPFEVLAIDDGSADGGPALVADFAARDARVRPLATGGLGLVPALTMGLAHARGEFLARMDADDISLPGRFAAQLDAMACDPRLGALGTLVEGFPDQAVGEGLRRYIEWQNAIISPADHAREIYVESPLCHPSVMLRRTAIDHVGGYRDTIWAEDYDLWLRLHAAGFHLAKIPSQLLRWRHREGRATFADPRYDIVRFMDAKAGPLAAHVARLGRPMAVWGAGPTGKRLARALERHGRRAERFVDIDPRKIGRIARGAPIVSPDRLERGAHTVVVAVGARGAREIIRAHLRGVGFVEGDDYLCAS
jgi:glycosyltransferase involved in cell wall biosynthesis